MPDDQNDDEPDPGRLRQMMEEANRRAADAEARASAAERKDLFRDAGLDLANKQHAAFAKAYDGDSDPDAIRTYVTELGITEPAPPQEPPAPGADEAGLIRIAEAARDSGAPPPTPNRREQAIKDFEAAARKKTSTKSEMERLAREVSRAGGFAVKEDYE